MEVAVFVVVFVGLMAVGFHPMKGGLARLVAPKKPPDAVAAELAAASGGHPTRIAPYSHFEQDSGLLLVVEGLCSSVALWRLGSPPPVDLPAHPLPEIGDPAFDRSFRVLGPRADILALLDSAARGAIASLLGGTVRVGRIVLHRGSLSVEVPTSGFANTHPGLHLAARGVGTLARHLVSPEGALERVARSASADPEPGVRLASLALLIDEHPSDPNTRFAVSTCLADADPEVRLRAALAAGPQGREVLVALALDRSATDSCAARAVHALGAQLPLEAVETLAWLASRGSSDPDARPATMNALAAAVRGNPAVPEALLVRLARGTHDPYGPAMIDAVCAGNRPGAEVALLAALEPQLSPRLAPRLRTVEAAASWLGALGSVEAVLPLEEVAKRHGGAIESSARRSIREIQSRLAGSPGRLTLAGTDAGALSLATDADGRVSLPDPNEKDR